MNVQSMYVCPECVPSEPYSCGGPHLNSRKKQRRYEFFDAIRVVPAEPTDEMVERAGVAYGDYIAECERRRVAESKRIYGHGGAHIGDALPKTDEAMRRALRAAFSTSRVPTEEDR